MFDQITLSLIHQISKEGLTDETTEKLMSLADTLLDINDYDSISIANIQTLLLLLYDFEIKPVAKRLVDELRYRLVRFAIKKQDNQGTVISQYTTSVMNRDIVEKIYDISVMQDGTCKIDTQYSIQPLIPDNDLILNDLGALVLNDINNQQEEIVLSLEKFEIPRVGCCGLIRTDMIYPIGKTCTEDAFIKEALDLIKSYGVGGMGRTADTYSVEYFIGKPGQNFREAGKSLYLFELMDDKLWHYFKDGVEVFAKDLNGVEELWH